MFLLFKTGGVVRKIALKVCSLAVSFFSFTWALEENIRFEYSGHLFAFENAEQITKYTWKNIENLQFQDALFFLEKAVDYGDRKAALFLANEYAKGDLLVPKDHEKQDFYEKKYASLKSERNFKFDDELGIEKQRYEIQRAQYSRTHPDFTYVVEWVKRNGDFSCFLKSPKDVLKNFISQITDDRCQLFGQEDINLLKPTFFDDLQMKELFPFIVSCLLSHKASPLIAFNLCKIIEDLSDFSSEQKQILAAAVHFNSGLKQTSWFQNIVNFLNEETTKYSCKAYSPELALKEILPLFDQERRIQEGNRDVFLSLFAEGV